MSVRELVYSPFLLGKMNELLVNGGGGCMNGKNIPLGLDPFYGTNNRTLTRSPIERVLYIYI